MISNSVRLRLIDWLQRAINNLSKQIPLELRGANANAKSGRDLDDTVVVGIQNARAKEIHNAIDLPNGAFSNAFINEKSPDIMAAEKRAEDAAIALARSAHVLEMMGVRNVSGLTINDRVKIDAQYEIAKSEWCRATILYSQAIYNLNRVREV